MKNLAKTLRPLCFAAAIAFAGLGCDQPAKTAAKESPKPVTPVVKETPPAKPATPQPAKPAAAPKAAAAPEAALSKVNADWKPFRSEVTVSDVSGQSGAKALLVKTTKDLYSGLSFGTDDKQKPDGTIQVKPNTAYHATIYVKGTGEFANVELQFATLNADGKPGDIVKRALNDKWQRIDLKFKTGPATSSIGFLLGKRNKEKSVSFYVDDLNLGELPAK